MSVESLKGKGGLEGYMPTGSEGQDVRDTKMLNATAKEHPGHISADNDLKEYDSGKASLGTLGHRGK